MAQVTILTERELRHLVKLDSAVIKAVGNGFRALATQAVQMPLPLRLDVPEHNGEVDVKTAYVPGIPSFALKVSPGFFNNPAIGLPSLNGLMILCSATTGLVEAILFDNGYLTDIRTAAAGAIAADHLARQNAVRVGIVGAGAQARLQLAALLLVRPIEAVMIWARDRVKADAFAALCGREFALATGSTDTVEALCAASDIVVTTTPSTTPLIPGSALRPGLHLTAMGADAEHKNELAPDIIARCDIYVPDHQSQCAKLGELHHAIAVGLVERERRFVELGEIVAGLKPGRQRDAQITVADLTGTGVQDTVIATLARQRADAHGIGTIIDI